MKKTNSGSPSKSPRHNDFIQIRILNPFEVHPAIDKDVLSGRLQKTLREVGSDGSLTIRSRMITAIASTHFKTINGLPVTLIGLHGKDEVLALGPKWAIERLAYGDRPDYEFKEDDCLEKAKAIVATEISYLEGLPEFYHQAIQSCGSESERIICGMFRTNMERISIFFANNDIYAFQKKYLAEALELKELIDIKIESSNSDERKGFFCTDGLNPWWISWLAEHENPYLFNPKTDRHITVYEPLTRNNPRKQPIQH